MIIVDVLFGFLLLAWGVYCLRALILDAALRYMALAGIVGLAAIFFFINLSNLRMDERFRREGVTTYAVVTGIFPKEHNSIAYRYSVEGATWTGRGFAPRLAEDLVIGERIRIQYLRSKPSEATARFPGETLSSTLQACLIGACWLVSFVVNVTFYRKQRERRRGAAEVA